MLTCTFTHPVFVVDLDAELNSADNEAARHLWRMSQQPSAVVNHTGPKQVHLLQTGRSIDPPKLAGRAPATLPEYPERAHQQRQQPVSLEAACKKRER